jgi:hypothetical protein
MHRAALQGLRMVGNKLTAKDEEAYNNKGTHKHSFKNRIGDRTGETIGSGFYRSDHWFTGSLSGFLR